MVHPHWLLPLWRTGFRLLLCAAAMMMVGACSSDDDDGDASTSATENANANDWYGGNYATRLEMPALLDDDNMRFIVHKADISDSSSKQTVNYAIEYDASLYHSRWVAFTFNDTTNAKNVSRSNSWAEEPDLNSDERLPTTAYSGSGYNRGHLCASYDRLYSTEANEQTFYMSNMSPQIGNFNSGYWVTLEGLIQTWGRSGTYTNLYVCKGGTTDQLLTSFQSKNADGDQVTIPVPKYYFAAVLAEFDNNGTKSYQAIGFLMEHKDYGYTYQNQADVSLMKDHAMSIDALEEETGIDFFCNLSDKLENTVEKSYNTSAWTWK